jgi:CHAD domain-containing protein
VSYHLKRKESVAKGIKRTVWEQIDSAAEDLTNEAMDRHEAVHEARKRIKKIRAVLRLIRAELGPTYGEENAWFSDTGRKLSTVRDAEAMIECFDGLRKAFEDELPEGAFAAVRDALVTRRQRIADEEVDLDAKADEVAAELRSAKDRVDRWPLASVGGKTIIGGLRRAYARGRKAQARALRNPTPENFHSWRKRVKDHWYHCWLLRDMWPKRMKPRRKAMKQLADLLGDYHDLVALRNLLRSDPGTFGPPEDVDRLYDLAIRRMAKLRTAAHELAETLYAERPRSLANRLSGCWNAWKAGKKRPSFRMKRRRASPGSGVRRHP